jgi:hypothetical protein
VLAHDHGEPERIRQAAAVRPAVGGEREHRLDECLEAERGADLGDEAQLAVGRVAEPVQRAGLDHHDVAGPGDDLLAADRELGLAGDDLEPLRLEGVDVRGCDEAVGLDGHVDQDALACRIGGGLQERHALAGDRVDQCVSCANHCPYLTFRRIDLTHVRVALTEFARISEIASLVPGVSPVAGQPARSIRRSSAREESPSFAKTLRRW